MFTYRSAEGGCKTYRNWPIGERLYRFANADMNPVATNRGGLPPRSSISD